MRMIPTDVGWDGSTIHQWQTQMFQALELLVYAFDEAAKRDGSAPIEAALGRNEVAEGLRTLLIRMVFALLAEARGQLPVDCAAYRDQLSVTELASRLAAGERAGCAGYERLVLMWRAMFLGVQTGELQVPALGGVFFDPDRYPFLEGRVHGEPVGALPTIPDEALAEVFEQLTRVGGRYGNAFAFDYAAFDPHDLGTAFEYLMGRRDQAAVGSCPDRGWPTMSTTLAELLLNRRPPWPEPTLAERWAELEERERHRWSLYSESERAAMRLRSRRDRVRYGCRRLRAGTEYRWQRPLPVVRAETAAALEALGHEGLARWFTQAVAAARRGPAVQMELGL